MKNRIATIVFMLILIVSATPAQAQIVQKFEGTGYAWGGTYWTDSGSFPIYSTMDGAFRRTQQFIFHAKGTAGNLLFDGGPTFQLVFHSKDASQPTHVYYFVEITNIGSGGTWDSTAGGITMSNKVGAIHGEFDAHPEGLGQLWQFSTSFSNWPNAHPESGVDYIISEIFSLDPITNMTFPSVVNQTGRITESAVGSGVGGGVLANSLFVGDTKNQFGVRSIVQFDTLGLPNNANITSATLHMTMNLSQTVGNTVGWGPTSYPNSITVKIGNPCIDLCTLKYSDWQIAEQTAGFMGPVIFGTAYVPVQNLSFSNYAQNISRTGPTEFRLQWNKITDLDIEADRIAFRSAGEQDAPTITVYFTLP